MSTVVTPPTTMPNDAYVVALDAQPDLWHIERMPRGAERKTAAWEAMTQTARTSQAPAIELATRLRDSGAITGWEALTSPNAIVVDPVLRREREVLEAFAVLGGVRSVYDQHGETVFDGQAIRDVRRGEEGARPSVGLDLYSDGPTLAGAPAGNPWGIDMLGAPAAWAQGADGRGLVYGSIDTGVDATHEALADHYRGTKPDGSVDHERSWFDFGDRRSAEPVDDDGHGTHTTGSAVGGSAERPLGVAPGAKFIGVAGLKGFLDVRLKALQWMQAPTLRDGTAPDPAMAPDVVGMSWWTGPSHSDVLQESMANLVAAGIEPVKSAGNNGPGPETISAPGGFTEVTSAAAVDMMGGIAAFSSRGPSPLPHTGGKPIWKPDVAAPGKDITSSIPGDRYGIKSGTSMAQPHLAGAILDVLSVHPDVSHDQLQIALGESARDVGATGRDLEFGHGIVDIPKAIEAVGRRIPRPR